MATLAQLESALVKADAAGNAEDAKVLAGEIRRMRSTPDAAPAASQPIAPPKSLVSSKVESFLNPANVEGQMAKAGVGALRAAPVVAAVVAPPVGLAGYLGLAGISAGGEAAARAMEGKDVLSRQGVSEMGKAAVLGGTPIGKIAQSKNIFLAGAQGLKTGAIAAGTAAAGETVRQSIDQQRLATYDSVLAGVKDTTMPSVLGFLGGGVAGRLSGFASKADAVNDSRQRLTDVGVQPENMTLGMLDPSKAGWEQHIAARSPELAQKIGTAHSDITKHFYRSIGEAGSNTEIAAKLQPLVGKVDAAEVAFQNAEKAHQAALTNFQRASEVAANPEMKPQFIAKASSDLMTAVTAKARAVYAGNAAVGDIATNTEKAEQLTKVVHDLFDARTAIAKELYRDTRIPLEQPLFSKSDLVTAAESGLASVGRLDTSDAGKILETIKSAGADPSQTHISLAQFQSLRAKMSDAFVNLTDPKKQDIAEGLASRAYNAMGDASKGTIRQHFGDETLAKYDAAQAFWRDTSQARDSALGRSLLQRGDILDSTLSGMASGIVAGNVDELTQFKKFVGYIGEKNPAVAELAIQNMAGAVKNAMLVRHSSGGKLNADGLLSDLITASNFRKLPFPVESLGFGSVDTIKEWRKVVREFPNGQVSDEVMNEVLTNPEVQKVLQVGGRDTNAVLRQATAKEVFSSKARVYGALAHAQATATARTIRDDADRLARKMKWNAEETREAFDKAMADPVLSAFSGKGAYKLTDEMGKTGSGTVAGLISSMDPATAGKLMGGLRKNDAQLAELVERRILTDELKKLSGVDTKIPGSTERLDLSKVSQFFNPIDRANSRLAFLENTVSKESMGKMKTLATKLAAIEDDTRRGRFPTDKELQGLVDSMSLSAAAAGSKVRPGLMITILGRLRDSISKKAYGVVSAAMVDPDIANAVFDTTKSLSEAIGSLPAQKAYLLANDAVFQEDVKKLEGQPGWKGRLQP